MSPHAHIRSLPPGPDRGHCVALGVHASTGHEWATVWPLTARREA